MKKLVYIIIVIILCGSRFYAQSDTLFEAFEKEFEEFNHSVEEEFRTFKAQNDSAFLEFLQKSWQEFEVFEQSHPIRPKPKYQPSIKEEVDTIYQEIEIQPINYDSAISQKQTIDSVLEESMSPTYQSRAVIKHFTIYGFDAEIYYYPEKLPSLNIINEKSIAAFYRELSDNNTVWDLNIRECRRIIQARHFNDWGYYKLLTKVAENIFNNENERTLFIWYAFVKSDYIIKVGYDNTKVFLILPSEHELYNIQYLKENNLRYYLFNGGDNRPAQIKTYPGYYTDKAKIFSFSLNEMPVLPDRKIELRPLTYKKTSINLEFNPECMAFLSSYPQCALPVYFTTPLSLTNLNLLDKIFISIFQGKTNREKVDILLNFIQGSIGYKNDQEQFGRERYMFAEECLYYPYSDCEDRTVLMAQLVKHYTGLPAIGLEFKEHVTLAVHFPDEEEGNYVLFEGKKYFICDSTYINASTGMIPADLKMEKPKVITY